MEWLRRETLQDVAWIMGSAVSVLIAIWLGSLVLQDLYWKGVVGRGGFQVVLAGIAIAPAVIAHGLCWMRGIRSFVLWLLWFPGLATYAAVPFRNGGDWEMLGIGRFVWAWMRMLVYYPNSIGADERTGMMAFAAVLSAALLAAGGLWHGSLTWLRHSGGGFVTATDRRRRGEPGLPSATWASRRDVLKRFSVPGGIVLGELTNPETETPGFHAPNRRTWGKQGRGPLIAMDPADGNGHVLVTSQAAAYKTTGIVLPNILTYQGPLLVFDPKCEVYARTRKARNAMGFRTVVIDETSPFDPARLIASLAMDHPSAFRRMARMIIPNESASGVENGQFFKEASEKLLGAMLGYHAVMGSSNILGDIAEMLARLPQDIYEEVEPNLAKIRWDFVRNQLRSLDGMEQRFYGSIATGITNQLVFAEYPDVARFITMSSDSEIVNKVLDPNTDIFLNIPQHIAEDYPALVRSVLGSVLVATQLIEQPEAPQARRLILVDEAAKLGRMDTLADIRDRGRAIGLHLMMIYQTPGELVRIWGEAGATSWRDGCSAVITGPVSARTSATDMSTMLGTKTIRVMTESRSTSNQVMTPVSGSVSKSEQEQLRDVPLLSPTEIAKLPRHASIITSSGFKPILATKAISFTRPEMASRVRSSEEIANELQVTRSRQAFLKRAGNKVTDPEGSSYGTEEAEEANRSNADEEDHRDHKEKSNGQFAPEDDDLDSVSRTKEPEAVRQETYNASDIECLDIYEDYLLGKDQEEISKRQKADTSAEISPKEKPVGQMVPVSSNADEEEDSKPSASTAADAEASGLKAADGDTPTSTSTTDEDKAKDWDIKECDVLIRGITKGKTLAQIAVLVGRTEAEVLLKSESFRKSGVIGVKLMRDLQKGLEQNTDAEREELADP